MVDRYPSTVFMCEVSDDCQFIRCDFPSCSVHSPSRGHEWILNTPRNVAYLAAHVDTEVFVFVSAIMNQGASTLLSARAEYSSFAKDLQVAHRVLVIFELQDPQCAMGSWINPFLAASRGSENICMVQRVFYCRKQLLTQISEFFNILHLLDKKEVMVVLSCHSSTQGQVFSCTPSPITAEHGFEEFCSLHDFVLACQDAFGRAVRVVHVSSCYTLKVDSSHQGWPVAATWYRDFLRVTLGGSTREVYETGSQAADLLLILQPLLDSQQPLEMGYEILVHRMKRELCPDLTVEMGLVIATSQLVQELLHIEPVEDRVTPKGRVLGNIAVLLLVVQKLTFDGGLVSFAKGILNNLQARCMSDIEHIVELRSAATFGELVAVLNEVPWRHLSQRIMVLIIADEYSGSFGTILEDLLSWAANTHLLLYGVHLAGLAVGQATLLQQAEVHPDKTLHVTTNTRTGYVGVFEASMLLYLIQLVTGENGRFRASHSTTNTEIKHGALPLSDAYQECCSVMPGLARLLSLQLSCFSPKPDSVVKPRATPKPALEKETCVDDISVFVVQIDGEDEVISDSRTTEPPAAIPVVEPHPQKLRRGLRSKSSPKSSLVTQTAKLVQPTKSPKNPKKRASSSSVPLNRSLVAPIFLNPTMKRPEYMDMIMDDQKRRKKPKTNAKVLSICQQSYCSKRALTGVRLQFCNGKWISNLLEEKTQSAPAVTTAAKPTPTTSLDYILENVGLASVTHYSIMLEVDFSRQVMHGKALLFVEPVTQQKRFQMMLDSSLVDINSVYEANVQNFPRCLHSTAATTTGADRGFPMCCSVCFEYLQTSSPPSGGTGTLQFVSRELFLEIWNVEDSAPWPRAVMVEYSTTPKGHSLAWTKDQDGRPCVLCPGGYSTNRSMIPCQETFPVMSTWQVFISVPTGCTVLMSAPEVMAFPSPLPGDNRTWHTFCMAKPLPMSTLALASGWFSQVNLSCPVRTASSTSSEVALRIRILAAPSLLDKAERFMKAIVPSHLSTCCALLGPYPFTHLDFVVAPRCFSCLGYMSPCLAFISQSLLSDYPGMESHIAHEISHTWFGLLINHLNWTEEWLSEGFATYIEERVLRLTSTFPTERAVALQEIRWLVRYRLLKMELQQEDEESQLLRPKKDIFVQAEASNQVSIVKDSEAVAVALHVSKSRRLSKITYTKGYFLLCHLASVVGIHSFDLFLRKFVDRFSGKLLTSEALVDFYTAEFGMPSEFKESIISSWLDSPSLPQSFIKFLGAINNSLLREVDRAFGYWKELDKYHCGVVGNSKMSLADLRRYILRLKLESEQLVLLLEKLIELDRVHHSTLFELRTTYSLSSHNAEIRHRWCELVVKHSLSEYYCDVKTFLGDDQGMGLYLYGEMYAGSADQRGICDAVVEELDSEMDLCVKQTVDDMKNGRY